MDRINAYRRYKDEGKIEVESTKKIKLIPFDAGLSGGSSPVNTNTGNTAIGYSALTQRYSIPRNDFYNPDILISGDNVSVKSTVHFSKETLRDQTNISDQSIIDQLKIKMETWALVFLPFSIFAGLALMFHGFPKIHIGSKHDHYHYYNDEEEE